MQRRADRFHAPFSLTFEPDGVWVVCRETEWAYAGRGLHPIRVEPGYRMITLDMELHPETADLLSTVTDLLARSGILAHPLPTFHRDRLLIPEYQLDQALRVLKSLLAAGRRDPEGS